jgi:ribosomal protein L40E
MFCDKCGAENPDDATFCGQCGHKFKVNVKSDVKHEKNTILALVISFLLTGLGIAYAGNVKKGILLFIGGLIFTILALAVPVCTVIAVIIWVYALYETYNEVKRAQGVANPNLIEDFKSWDSSKKAAGIIVAIIILFIVVASVFSAFAPRHDYSSYSDDYSTSDYSGGISSSGSSSSSSSGSYSSSSNGRDVESHYEGDAGSADTYGTVYDDGSVESHQSGHTDYGDYQIDSYMDSNGNLHGTVDVGGQTYHVSS